MTAELPLLLASGFLAAIASGLAGFAFVLLVSGAWYHVLPPVEAAPLVVAASVLVQIQSAWVTRRIVRWPVVVPMVAGGLAGIPLGTLVLAALPARPMAVGVGVLLVVYGGWMLWRLQRPGLRLLVPRAGRAADAAIGFGGGVLGGIGGFSGVFPTVWCDLRGWVKDEARGVYQPYILTMQVAAAVAMAASGLIGEATLWALLPLLPALMLGVALGTRLYGRLPPLHFRRLILGLLMLSGLGLIL